MKSAEIQTDQQNILLLDSFEDAALLAKALDGYVGGTANSSQSEILTAAVTEVIEQFVHDGIRTQINDWIEVHKTDRGTIIYQDPYYYLEGRPIDFSDFNMDDPDWDGFIELRAPNDVVPFIGNDKDIAIEAVKQFGKTDLDEPTQTQIERFLERYE